MDVNRLEILFRETNETFYEVCGIGTVDMSFPSNDLMFSKTIQNNDYFRLKQEFPFIIFKKPNVSHQMFQYRIPRVDIQSLTSIDNWGKYYSNAHLINDSKIIFNQIMKESDRMSATGNGKQSRRRRAVTCADRPNFACVNGIPQLWTRLSQTDGRRFACDLNDFQKNPEWIKDLIVNPNFRLSYKLGDRQRRVNNGWWNTHIDGGGYYPKKGEEETFCPRKHPSVFRKSTYINARLRHPCKGDATKKEVCYINGRTCDPCKTNDPMDFYGAGFAKYNKRTQKFKHGKAWLKCREPAGPNGQIVARVMCRVGTHEIYGGLLYAMRENKDKKFRAKMQNRIEIQIQYNNRSLSAKLLPKGKWFDVRDMHSKDRKCAKGEPDTCSGRIDRHYQGYCIGEHCYNRFSINKTISDATTQFERIDEICKLGEFKIEPYEECTGGKGTWPPIPNGARNASCHNKSCWPECDAGKLPEYPQRFRCEVGFDAKTNTEIFDWHITTPYGGLSRCIGCPTLAEIRTKIISTTVEVEESSNQGLPGFKIFCDKTKFNTLKFDWVSDPANPAQQRQKEYTKTYKNPKYLMCTCEVKVLPSGLKKRECDFSFARGNHMDSSKGKKFQEQWLKRIECYNSNWKTWNRLKNPH